VRVPRGEPETDCCNDEKGARCKHMGIVAQSFGEVRANSLLDA
jgi:hypothetical protein